MKYQSLLKVLIFLEIHITKDQVYKMTQKQIPIRFVLTLFLIFLLLLFLVLIVAIFQGITGKFLFENYAIIRDLYFLLLRVIGYDVVSIILVVPLILLCMLMASALIQYQIFVNDFEKRVYNEYNKLPDETKNELMKEIKAKIFRDPKIEKREKKFKKQVVDDNKEYRSND